MTDVLTARGVSLPGSLPARPLAWCAWTGEATSLAGVALRTAHVLDRGPRQLPI